MSPDALYIDLLDIVSRLYCRGSVVRKLWFLRKFCMDPGQILCVAPSPPYLKTNFFFLFKIFNFYDFFFVFFSMGPYGGKNLKKATPLIFHLI